MAEPVPVVVLAPGYHGQGIARSLGRLGIPVHGVHADRRSPAARSRFWVGNSFWDFEHAAPLETVAMLRELGQRIGCRPLLIPTDDESCRLVDDHARALSQHFRFPLQPAGLVDTLVDKRKLYRLCREHGVPTAETAFPRSIDDVVAFSERAVFPVMLKGRDTKALRRRTGFSMVRVDDPAALRRWYERLMTSGAELMLQEYIPGGPDAVWMFNGYFDGTSRCLFGLTGRKLRQYPAYTGVTSLGVCLANDTVAERTMQFMQRLDYRGILDIGYKYDRRNGEYKLLDVNPRIGTTFRLFVDSNELDVARALYLDLTGQPVEAGTMREGRRWLVENFDLVSSLRYALDRRLTPRQWIRSFKGVEEASWFARDDLAPFAWMWIRSVQRALRRGKEGRARRTPWKRPMDLLLAGALLVLSSPLFLALALAVWLDSGRPIFYRQERIGREGKPFTLLKFRSMVRAPDDRRHRELAEAWFRGDDSVRGYKSMPDPRVTRVGRFLRRTSLDELPQLINVLRGEMTLVGPRPAIRYELEHYQPHYFRRQSVPPGITGLWQISRRDHLTAPEMMALDLRYAQECSPWMDLKILALTGPALVSDWLGGVTAQGSGV